MDALELDNRIINLVQGYPFIFDKKMAGFKDPKRKSNAWNEMASQTPGHSGDEIAGRWKCLRELYVRKRGKIAPSGSGATPSDPFMKSMAFLEPFIMRRRKISNLTAEEDSCDNSPVGSESLINRGTDVTSMCVADIEEIVGQNNVTCVDSYPIDLFFNEPQNGVDEESIPSIQSTPGPSKGNKDGVATPATSKRTYDAMATPGPSRRGENGTSGPKRKKDDDVVNIMASFADDMKQILKNEEPEDENLTFANFIKQRLYKLTRNKSEREIMLLRNEVNCIFDELWIKYQS